LAAAAGRSTCTGFGFGCRGAVGFRRGCRTGGVGATRGVTTTGFGFGAAAASVGSPGTCDK
jgi:hypothetical protein